MYLNSQSPPLGRNGNKKSQDIYSIDVSTHLTYEPITYHLAAARASIVHEELINVSPLSRPYFFIPGARDDTLKIVPWYIV